MYPNYTKTFLNLEGVSIKKVVQADSFIKISIQSQPTEQTCDLILLYSEDLPLAHRMKE